MIENRYSILHIASDEKFIDAANYIFEKAFPGCNKFIIPKSLFNKELQYIKTTRNVEVVSFDGKLISYLSGMTQNYDCIVLHGITEINSSVFLNSEVKNKFIGILWGAEFYSQKNFSEERLLGELTRSIRLPETIYTISEKIKGIVRRLIYHKYVNKSNCTELAALSLNYFCFPYIEEFNFFIDRKLISKNSRYIPFTYYPLQYIFNGMESAMVRGNDILLGNSASMTNNHLEAFEILKSLNIGNRKIIVPLSYGNMHYADFIQKEGQKLFKEGFRPLRKFLPLAEYTSEISSCGIVIMNHCRQQAVGNIYAMIYLGSKVYLNKANTLFKYLRRIGINVGSVEEDLHNDNPVALDNLPNDEIERNRSIIREVIGEDSVVEILRESINKYFSVGNNIRSLEPQS